MPTVDGKTLNSEVEVIGSKIDNRRRSNLCNM
jgi:hypothetical protein